MGIPGRERTHSISVSPKTMVVDLPPSRNVSLNGSSAGQSVGAVHDRAETAGFAHPGSLGARTSSTTSSKSKDLTDLDSLHHSISFSDEVNKRRYDLPCRCV